MTKVLINTYQIEFENRLINFEFVGEKFVKIIKTNNPQLEEFIYIFL